MPRVRSSRSRLDRFLLLAAGCQLLLVVLVGTACSSRAARPTTTLPTTYTCHATTFVHRGDSLEATADHAPRLGWHDDEGDHFIAWPLSTTDLDAVEYVVPADPRQDAIQRTYDASKGSSTADWRLIKRELCPAMGGYTDALTRWMRGATLDEVALQLPTASRDEASQLVHQALAALQRRYRRDR